MTALQFRRLSLNTLFAGIAFSQTIAIQHVTVIDATGRAPQSDSTAIIAGGRISAVGPSKITRTPQGARIVDGTGEFLIPGLWDMHVHGAADGRSTWTYPLFIANGVVGVREMFGPANARDWRARQAGASAIRPTVYLSSPIVDGPNPQWPESIVVATESEGRAAVEQQLQRGADFIKVYSRLPRDAYFAIADEARRLGIPFAGHVPASVTAAEASDSGQRSIEHLSMVIAGCSREEKEILPEVRRLSAVLLSPTTPMAEKMSAGRRQLALEARLRATYDEAIERTLYAKFIANQTWQCPTLTVLRALMEDPQAGNDPRTKYLSRDVRSYWAAGFNSKLPPEARTAIAANERANFGKALQVVGGMHRAGVKLLAGTDALNPQCFPGFGLHDELSLMVEAGLPPMAALQAATRNPAEFMGQADRRGTVEPGKIADLILLSKDPLADIHNTRSIEAVVLGGKWIPRSALDAMLTEAERTGALR
jgi:imidazolonepropionase-like amidohydrolase